MIKKFSAKNVRNFNEFSIDFSIKKSKRTGEFTNDDDFFKTENDKILKIIGVTGANASGKTTLLELFKLYEIWAWPQQILIQAEKNAMDFFYTQYIQNFKNSKKQDTKKIFKIPDFNQILNSKEYINKIFEEFSNILGHYFKINCFITNKPIIYQVNFINNENEELEHYLEININGSIIFKLKNISKNKIIINETFDYLNINVLINLKTNKTFEIFADNINTLFIHINSLFEFSDVISIENFIISNTTLNVPFLSSIDNRIGINNFIYEYVKKGTNKIKFIEWVKLADPSINDISFNDKEKIIGFFINKKIEKINFYRLSKGTLKWIYLFYILEINNFDFEKDKKNSDKIIFIDGIENYLHNKLVKTILRIISQSNKKIQLIFTTHNANIFEDTFRHQGVYLIENNYDKSLDSNYFLNCLSKYNLKKDKKILSLFLYEKIGSHPDGINILDWIEKYYGKN